VHSKNGMNKNGLNQKGTPHKSNASILSPMQTIGRANTDPAPRSQHAREHVAQAPPSPKRRTYLHRQCGVALCQSVVHQAREGPRDD
jgi:hypothetical protein